MKLPSTALNRAIKKDGMLWISWYKKAAKMPTDITEDVVRDVALARGLVDVKVAAIDAQWSGTEIGVSGKGSLRNVRWAIFSTVQAALASRKSNYGVSWQDPCLHQRPL